MTIEMARQMVRVVAVPSPGPSYANHSHVAPSCITLCRLAVERESTNAPAVGFTMREHA